MRAEDLDWEIYLALLNGQVRTAGDLVAAGYEASLVEASLSRLGKALLVERDGDSVRVLSFQESLLICQLKHEEDSPLVFENGVIRPRNGVIRVRTDGERKG